MGVARTDLFQPTAPEVRQPIAHGVSRGTAVIMLKPGGRQKTPWSGRFIYRPSGACPATQPSHPRLTPWAAFDRCSAAKVLRKTPSEPHPLLITPGCRVVQIARVYTEGNVTTTLISVPPPGCDCISKVPLSSTMRCRMLPKPSPDRAGVSVGKPRPLSARQSSN